MNKELTKREAFVMAALQGILAMDYKFLQSSNDTKTIAENFAQDAVKFSDALIKKLNKTIPTR